MIKKFLLTSLLGYFMIMIGCNSAQRGKHLFILSGQSNMELLDPELSFTPLVSKNFGYENVIIVKDAWGGKPIMRWYKNWKLGSKFSPTGADLYDSLIKKVNEAINNEKLSSISFFWMQGERDAKMGYGESYKESLIGIYDQLKEDLAREDINFIIGRLIDYGNNKKVDRPHWMMIRNIQVDIALSDNKFDWINTDDLNDGFDKNGKEIKNNLHMSKDGYRVMGKRFANKGIELIKLFK